MSFFLEQRYSSLAQGLVWHTLTLCGVLQKQVKDFNIKVRAMNEELQRDVDNRYQILELAMSHKEHVSATLRDFLATANAVVEELEEASMWRKILN